jgi:hypothetical protein
VQPRRIFGDPTGVGWAGCELTPGGGGMRAAQISAGTRAPAPVAGCQQARGPCWRPSALPVVSCTGSVEPTFLSDMAIICASGAVACQWRHTLGRDEPGAVRWRRRRRRRAMGWAQWAATAGADHLRTGERAVASFCAAALTGICLGNVCSCPETLRSATARVRLTPGARPTHGASRLDPTSC